LNCIVVFTDGTIYFQVFDLSDVKPSDFIRYGLGCLERLAERGDNCAKNIRGNLRIMVCAFLCGLIIVLCLMGLSTDIASDRSFGRVLCMFNLILAVKSYWRSGV
jgi:hypothetical protein